jgi:hypothetical protein
MAEISIDTMASYDRLVAIKMGFRLAPEVVALMAPDEVQDEVYRFYEYHSAANGYDNPYKKEVAKTDTDPNVNPNPETFSEALEAAFWLEGGVEFLRRIAKSDPLEFAKLCVKLIAADAKGGDNNNFVVNVVNLANDAVKKEEKKI